MKTITFNNGSKNETVEITSLVQIGPERFVATTTEGFEIDLHTSHIVEVLEYIEVALYAYEGRNNRAIECGNQEAVIKNDEYIKFLNVDNCGGGYVQKFQKIRENGRGQYANIYNDKFYFYL